MPSGVGLEVFVAFILIGCLVGAVFAGRRLREIPMPDVRARRETLPARLRALGGQEQPSDADWRWLEDGLARSGAGRIASREVITRIRERHEPPQDPGPLLVEEVVGMFAEDRAFELPQGRLAVVLVAGTGRSVPAGALGKLARRLAGGGRSVALGTADTQRSKVMAESAQRAGAHAVDGSTKPWTPVAATVEGAREHDVLLLEAIRPARRGQPRLGPGEVRRAVEAASGRPPDAVVLVLDAATVAHVIPQARALVQPDLATGVLLTGMDLASTRATALRVREALGLPVWFVATGAGVEDLEPFEPRAYASSLVR